MYIVHVHYVTCTLHVHVHVYTKQCISTRTLLKQGPYGRKQVARRVIIITPGSLVKVRVLLTLGAHAQRGLQYLVCKSVRLSVRPSVSLSVTAFSATTRNKAAKKRYQLVQCHTGLILKMAICVLVLRSKVMA